ncbi:MAG: NADH-quinone oxidoreductase subunit NuoF [Candidatus Aerophobetes bacterium]
MKIKNTEGLRRLYKQYAAKISQQQKVISLCTGTGCRGSKALEVLSTFGKELRKRGLEKEVILKETGCHGFCERGPLVVIRPENIFYQQVAVKDIPEIIDRTIVKGEVVESLLFEMPGGKGRIIKEDDVPFYKGQKRVVFGQNGYIDPKSIEDYIARGGYLALAKALAEFSPEDIIEEVKASGLRGRGGGGFLTGRKWRFCRDTQGALKFVICNADEGDPGAYMDRSLLEGNPHSIIEGMVIGAYAVGASQGYVYVRAEYPLAIENLLLAFDSARKLGLLGEDILGTVFSFDIKISKGAGAFVCGEETALIASIEGKRGMPRPRPPFPAVSGLWGKPTLINNVETWANIPLIIDKGSDSYAKTGTKNSKGTKIFSLVGKIMNTGLVEVPMGITLKKIIYDIGGGIPEGKRFKAVQTGGPSGGCIPESLIDLPVDFDQLSKAGSMMGSGGMIVLDEDTCTVNLTRFFIEFTASESCGKCVPCRVGLQQMLAILDKITQGKAAMEDLDLLEYLAKSIAKTALCGLGQTAPNPVLSTLRYFHNEYEAHIKDKKCPAKVCKDLITYSIDEEACRGCLVCKKLCPQEAIAGERKQPHSINQDECIECGICLESCKFDAVKVE